MATSKSEFRSARVSARVTSVSSSELPKRSMLFAQTWTIPEFFSLFVPAYKSVNHGALLASLQWSNRYAPVVRAISPKRAANRQDAYLDKDELGRAYLKLAQKGEASIRFGVEKKGHGYTGERGDFCLVGGVIRRRELTVLYRSLELIGGLAYDLTLFDYLADYFETRWDYIHILATKAFVFALKGNSNEKLYPKLKEIFRERD
jgi:hypothetical protein